MMAGVERMAGVNALTDKTVADTYPSAIQHGLARRGIRSLCFARGRPLVEPVSRSTIPSVAETREQAAVGA